MTTLPRKRREIEKENIYEICREFYEEQNGKKMSLISGPGKEIIFYTKLIKINMKSISNQKIKVTTGIGVSCLVRLA